MCFVVTLLSIFYVLKYIDKEKLHLHLTKISVLPPIPISRYPSVPPSQHLLSLSTQYLTTPLYPPLNTFFPSTPYLNNFLFSTFQLLLSLYPIIKFE